MWGTVRIAFLYMLVFLTSGRNSCAQEVSIEVKKANFQRVLQMIYKQTKVGFIYDKRNLEYAHRVTLKVENMPFNELMDTLLRDLPIKYEFIRGTCCLIRDVNKRYATVRGKILDGYGAPLGNACVWVNKDRTQLTNNAGNFLLHDISLNDSLSFSYEGRKPRHIKYNGESYITIELPFVLTYLPVIRVKGYTKFDHFSTAGLTEVSIQQNNAYRSINGAISLPVAGLLTTPSGNVSGASPQLQLRGQSSIGIRTSRPHANYSPLFVINGVPYATNYNYIQPVSPLNIMGEEGGNALANININDIGEIKILKDEADLAPYGSKGANGVILINTKPTKIGDNWMVKANISIGQITVAPKMMNTRQYREMRQEAFLNDEISPGELKAPDLVSWDSSRYTDFRKILLSSFLLKKDMYVGFSSSSSSRILSISLGHNIEKAVYPRNTSSTRTTMQFYNSYSFFNGRLLLHFTNQGAMGYRNTRLYELAGYGFLPPNIPQVGKEEYEMRTANLFSGLELKYHFSSTARFSFNWGYNRIEEQNMSSLPIRWPIIFMPPELPKTRYAIRKLYYSRVIEPVFHYNTGNSLLRYNLSLGASLQSIVNGIQNMSYSTAPSDTGMAYANEQINNTRINTVNLNFLSQLGFLLKGKYSVNITLRREGSNRLRISDRFANFGAARIGWVFSNDSSFKRSFPGISHGQIKGSFGVTGTDQYVANNSIGRLYPANTLQGSTTTSLPWVAAEDYGWQITRKIELGLELGLVENRIFLCLNVYRNRTGNQIIGYPISALGLNAIRVGNCPAVVQNKGVELALEVQNGKLAPLKWNSRLMITLPKNKLLSFPGLATSAYGNALVTGQSLTVQQGYKYTGVNSLTGLFEVADLNNDGRVDRYNDYRIWGDFDPRVYGSIDLALQYRNLSLDIFLEGRVQRGFSMLGQVYEYVLPGEGTINLPVEFLNRWRKPGDESNIQRLSADNSVHTRAAINKFIESDARYTSASYLRLQHIGLSYKLPAFKRDNEFLKTAVISLTGNNLYTVTDYKGADPQTQNIFAPSLQRSFTLSIKFSF